MTPGSKTFGKIPFLRFTLAFTIGTIISRYIQPSLREIWFLIILSAILFISKLVLNKKQAITKYSSAVLFLFLITCGFIYTSFHTFTQFDNNLPPKGDYTGYVLEKNTSVNKRSRYVVQIETASANDSIISVSEKIILTISDSLINSKLIPGHQILFSATLREITNNNNPGDFNYKGFLKKRGIRHQSFLWGNVHILPIEKKTLRSIAFNFRTSLLNKYREAGIDGDEFAVLAALTLGDKNHLTNELRHSFSASGAMHVLAVSGLHVGIIYFILNLMLSPLFRNKKAKYLKMLILIGLLWIYAFISGLSPSVMRAATMFSFVVIGENLNRKTNIYNTLALSAFVLMLINPLIIYEIGFQLSYAAVTSIVFFQPRIASLFKPKNRIVKYLWELFAVSIAAQIGTFVISIYYFNQFPVYFWISNYIVIPAASILLYGALLFFIFQFIPFLAQLFATIIEKTTVLMNSGVQAIEQLPGSLISNIWIDKITMLILFGAIITIGWFTAKKSFRLVLSTIFILVLLTTNAIYNYIKTENQTHIVFYNTYQSPLIGIVDGNTMYFYHLSDSITPLLRNTIDNSINFFKIKNTETIIESKKATCPVIKYDNCIIFKNTVIEIISEKEVKEPDNINFDINWMPYQNEITINNQEKYSTGTLINGKIANKKINRNNPDIALKTNKGAIIITPQH
jgi:competence protein ComEC